MTRYKLPLREIDTSEPEFKRVYNRFLKTTKGNPLKKGSNPKTDKE